MPVLQALTVLQGSATQCESLVVNCHQLDATGTFILPEIDRKQITIAGFLNVFIAWEVFLESSFSAFLTGSPTIRGVHPVKFASPPDIETAKKMLIGVNRYFDYANHEYVKKIANLYFQNGSPYLPHLDAMASDLADMRTIRNACAHITSTTQKALDALSLSITSVPVTNVDLYQLLTSIDPRAGTGDTVLRSYKNKIVVAAELIANG